MRVYDGPEHESLRAIARCLLVNYGPDELVRVRELIAGGFNVDDISKLTPFAANFCRKHLEGRLPIRGDYC